MLLTFSHCNTKLSKDASILNKILTGGVLRVYSSKRVNTLGVDLNPTSIFLLALQIYLVLRKNWG